MGDNNMSIISDFSYWLDEGKNTGEIIQKKSISAYVGRVSRVRDKFKNRGWFLEDVLKKVDDFEDWFLKEQEYLKSNATSQRDFKNTKAFLRAFWRFVK